MARVILMSQLAPEDVIIDLGNGTRYTIPGATPAMTMIELSRIYEDLRQNQAAMELAGADPGLGIRQTDLIEELDGRILELLQIRAPELTSTGLSGDQLGWLLGGIMSGFRELAGEEDDDPPPTPSRASRRAPRSAAMKTPSRRSSGSASS